MLNALKRVSFESLLLDDQEEIESPEVTMDDFYDALGKTGTNSW